MHTNNGFSINKTTSSQISNKQTRNPNNDTSNTSWTNDVMVMTHRAHKA